MAMRQDRRVNKTGYKKIAARFYQRQESDVFGKDVNYRNGTTCFAATRGLSRVRVTIIEKKRSSDISYRHHGQRKKVQNQP